MVSPATEPQKPEEPKIQPKTHVDVRGLYLTGWSAGSDDKFNDMVNYVKSSGLNAVVIDAKDDDGLITYKTEIPLAKEIGANRVVKIRDIQGRLKTLKEKNIYAIARIVVFVDPVLVAAKPDWAILNGKFRDRRGLPWGNPYNENVWKYNVEIAKEAAKLGFNEIQFDYVRFPEKDIEGVTHNVSKEKRVETITGFLKYAKKELEPYNVFMAADVFGLTTTVTDDMKIGQEYAPIAEIADYILPMVYPSHYNSGLFGLRNPNASPFETVYNSMVRGLGKTKNLDVKKHRPWIQDFSIYGVKYGKAEVEGQIRALARLGIRQFVLWDPNNKYTRNVDYSLIDKVPKDENPKSFEGPLTAEASYTGSTSGSQTHGGPPNGAQGSSQNSSGTVSGSVYEPRLN